MRPRGPRVPGVAKRGGRGVSAARPGAGRGAGGVPGVRSAPRLSVLRGAARARLRGPAPRPADHHAQRPELPPELLQGEGRRPGARGGRGDGGGRARGRPDRLLHIGWLGGIPGGPCRPQLSDVLTGSPGAWPPRQRGPRCAPGGRLDSSPGPTAERLPPRARPPWHLLARGRQALGSLALRAGPPVLARTAGAWPSRCPGSG